jgi:hypothetical protein
LIHRATDFEDFKAFGNNYERRDEAVELQASIFHEYGRILGSYKDRDPRIARMDRFSFLAHDLQLEILDKALESIGTMVVDREARQRASEQFWRDVDSAKQVARSGALMLEKAEGGKSHIVFYDMDKPGAKLSDFPLFAQWLAIPDLVRGLPEDAKPPIEVTVTDMPPLQTPTQGSILRHLMIIAIANGRVLPMKPEKGMLPALRLLNENEFSKSESLGLPVARIDGEVPQVWKGRMDGSVLFADPASGTVLTPEEVAEVLEEPSFHLFR